MTTGQVELRDVQDSDLPIFFEQQLDPEANWMAAFTAKDPSDRAAFMAHWQKIRQDTSTINKTILLDGQVVGNISSFELFGQPSVGYWIGKPFWGRGVATSALARFLEHVQTRPLYARVAKDNVASIRVLQKCGFVVCGEDRGFANARGTEVEELILELRA